MIWDGDGDGDDKNSDSPITMASSPNSNPNYHAPANPSGLRQSYTASATSDSESSSFPEMTRPSGNLNRLPSESTALLSDTFDCGHAHDGPCDHGTFSPRPASSIASLGRSNNVSQNGSRAPSPGASSESSLPILDSVVAYVSAKGAPDWRKRWARRMKSKTMHRSSELAERHGVKDSPFMYVQGLA